MKKLLQGSLVVICCLGLFGCPYESQVPITQPSIPVNKKLLGKWASKDEVYNTYTITQASANAYKIVQRNTIGDVSRYTGFLSEVKGALFMNVFSDSTKSYYLYRVKINPESNKYTLTPVDNDLPEHFGSSEALLDYVEKNMNLKSFYDEDDRAEFEQIEPATAHN